MPRKTKRQSNETPARWSAEEERDLLLLLIAVGRVDKSAKASAWDTVHAFFLAKGHNKARNALQTRWSRELKQHSDAITGLIDGLEEEVKAVRKEAGSIAVQRKKGRGNQTAALDPIVEEAEYEHYKEENHPHDALSDRRATPGPSQPRKGSQSSRSSHSSRQTTPISDTSVAGDFRTNLHGKGKGKSSNITAVKLLDIPYRADLQGLLPIIDTAGKVRGFMALDNETAGPDIHAFHETTLSNTLAERGYESVDVPGFLWAGDGNLLSTNPERSTSGQTTTSTRNGGNVARAAHTGGPDSHVPHGNSRCGFRMDRYSFPSPPINRGRGSANHPEDKTSLPTAGGGGGDADAFKIDISENIDPALLVWNEDPWADLRGRSPAAFGDDPFADLMGPNDPTRDFACGNDLIFPLELEQNVLDEAYPVIGLDDGSGEDNGVGERATGSSSRSG
ncbi:hypothetical protein JX266_002213 [Neoarthrinium moseri]|nr:hypothetical protein JX266_002213 [Neoarthrinium moseri]